MPEDHGYGVYGERICDCHRHANQDVTVSQHRQEQLDREAADWAAFDEKARARRLSTPSGFLSAYLGLS